MIVYCNILDGNYVLERAGKKVVDVSSYQPVDVLKPSSEDCGANKTKYTRSRKISYSRSVLHLVSTNP